MSNFLHNNYCCKSQVLKKKTQLKMKEIFGKTKKETSNPTIKSIRNLFRLKSKINIIKHRIVRDIRNLPEHEEEGYYKPVRVNKV